MFFEPARDFIFKILERDIDTSLTYHNIDHVRDVYDCAERIGREEGINHDDLRLILTAAAFHDSGFLKTRAGHEDESCRIARDILPVFDYDEEEIEKICGMIMATRLPQSPKNHLEEILADADLDYLGRDDFFQIGDMLFKELLNNGAVKNRDDWNSRQVLFMENHNYFTATASAQRNQKKDKNLEQVKTKLKT